VWEPAVLHRNARSQRLGFQAPAPRAALAGTALAVLVSVLGIANINWQAVGRELAAVGTAALSVPLRWLAVDSEFDATAWHRTPVVFVHGFLGDPTNFLAVRSHLAARGVRNFASFAYRPRLDYQRLADELGCTIEGVCRATGSRHVDLVGHSLGGLVARYLTESRGRPFVRRLVTLAAPYYATGFPEQELAIFGAHDPLVVPPLDGPRSRIRVVPDAGHLGLLYHPAVLHEVARYLSRPRGFVSPRSAEEREAA